jgi:hypothetical protein
VVWVWVILIISGLVIAACAVMIFGLGRAGRAAARRTGALWGGMAQLDADRQQNVPQVAQALMSLGQAYGGSRWTRYPVQRIVGGILVVSRTDLTWQPRLWLGRGHAASWSLPVADVASYSITRPTGSLVGQDVCLQTVGGQTVFLVISDARGLAAALNVAVPGAGAGTAN